MTDRPRQYDEGGYYPAEDPSPRAEDSPPREPTTVPLEQDTSESERDFRRTTPARVKNIRPERPRGRWGLISGTTLYVMCAAGSADYLPVSVRLVGHVLFWLALGIALLITLYRERIYEWDPAPAGRGQRR